MAFSMRLAMDSLASPSNLKRGQGGVGHLPTVLLPQGNLGYVINFCPVAMTKGRMTWQHDSVLNFMFSVIQKEAPKDIVQ